MSMQDLLAECGIDCDLEHILDGHKHQLTCPVAEWTHEKGFDSHPSAVIGVSKTSGELYFHCFTCKTSGSLGDLVFDYADFSGDSQLKAASVKAFPELSNPCLLKLAQLKRMLKDTGDTSTILEDCSELFEDQCDTVMRGSASAKYLKRRKISGNLCAKYGLRHDRKNSRVVLPVYSKDGKIVTAVGRALNNATLPKYYNYYTAPTGSVIGGLQLLKSHNKVVLVEGFFDMLNLARFSQDALPLCCFGARLTDEQAKVIAGLYYRKTHTPRFTIVLMYDGDSPGKSAMSQAASKLLKQHIPLTSIKASWLSTGLDPGSLSKSQYLDQLERAVTWRRGKRKRDQESERNLSQSLQNLRSG